MFAKPQSEHVIMMRVILRIPCSEQTADQSLFSSLLCPMERSRKEEEIRGPQDGYSGTIIRTISES
jgi:hypothetical protein